MPPLNQVGLDNLLAAWFLPANAGNTPAFVVVCDIGQGNINVIFDEDGHPFLYYDFGSPIKGGLFTTGTPENKYCFNHNPKFILSHWDHDHFNGGLKHIERGLLTNTDWLAPDQTVNVGVQGFSAVAKSMRKKLAQNGRTRNYVADAGVVTSTRSFYTIVKGQSVATGSEGMNDAGLALRIESPYNAGQYIFLAGDMDYNAGVMTHGCDTSAIAITAAHHGADIATQAGIPRPLAQGIVNTTRTLAYSFGWGNQYGHPVAPDGIDTYTNRNWADNYRLDTGGSEVEAEHPGPRGNVALLFPGTPAGCCRPASARLAHIQSAAIALLACAAAELELFLPGLGATQAGHAVAAAARQAAIEAAHPLVADALQLDDHWRTLLTSADSGATWTVVRTLPTHDIATAAIGAANAAALYIATNGGDLFYSANSGAAWANIASPLNLKALASPANNNLLAVNSLRQIGDSPDNAATWNALTAAGPNYKAILRDPAVATGIFAVDDIGFLAYSPDDGASWGPVSNGHRFTSLAGDPHNAGLLYGAANGELFRSLDNGANWASIATDVADFHAISVDPGNPAVLYAIASPYPLETIANRLDAPDAFLDAALTHTRAANTHAVLPDVANLAQSASEAVLRAAAAIMPRIVQGAIDAVALGAHDLKSSCRNAVIGAYNEAGSVATLAAARLAITANVLHTPVANAAANIAALNAPTAAEVADAASEAIQHATLGAIGYAKSAPRGFNKMRTAKKPPLVAKTAAKRMFAVRADVRAAIAAAASMAPAIPVNPQGAAPGPQTLGNESRRHGRIAAIAAIAAEQAGAAFADAAIAGSAVARVLLSAARGAPQIACHRFPNDCGEVCSMSIHYYNP